jgi:signal transduction histidine kinase
MYEDLWAKITAGQEWHGELCNRRKDGSLYWESASISPIVEPDGTVTHFVAVKEDISERRALQERLLRSQTLEAVARLAGGVAHDSTTPSGRRRYAELVLQPLAHAAEREDVLEIRQAAGHAAAPHPTAARVRQPRVFATADRRRQRGRGRVRACCGGCSRRRGPSDPAGGGGCAGLATWPPEHLLLNLVVNARDAMVAEGAVTIRTADGADPVRPSQSAMSPRDRT